jgi:hypothetical protein
MTLELLEAVRRNKLRVDELRKYSRESLTARFETRDGVTTLFHQIMMIGSEQLVRTALEIVGTDKQSLYNVLDADNNTPVHSFAMRVGAHTLDLTTSVIMAAPVATLRAPNKAGDTPAHLFPLCGNNEAVVVCRKRDPLIGSILNARQQTPSELCLERQRSVTETQNKSLRAENRRLAHNQSMQDEEEEKLKEFYRRMDILTKEYAANEAKLKQELEKSADRIRGLEQIALTKERVMKDAISHREKAEARGAEIKRQLDAVLASQSAANSVEATKRQELELREQELVDRSNMLSLAYEEIKSLQTESDGAEAAVQVKKIAAAETRAAELQSAVAEQTQQRDRAAAELRVQQDAVRDMQRELELARRRINEIETTKARAADVESDARAKFDETCAQIKREQGDERDKFETQIAGLREQNERSRKELEKLQVDSDEAKRLRESLDAERERAEQWRLAREESEQKTQALIAELEAERARPITVSPTLLRRTSASKVGPMVAAALAADEVLTPRSRTTQDRRSAIADDTVIVASNTRFFNNVVICVLESDCETIVALTSHKLELDLASIVDRAGTGLLELMLMRTVQNHYIIMANRGGKSLDSGVELQYARSGDMFELLVRAGVRWNGLPKFAVEHRDHLSSALASRLAVYEQWWAFADALLVGDKGKDTFSLIQRTLPTIGDPNHVLSYFQSKTLREQFGGRQMTYLHLAIELYTEHVSSIVELLLTVPGINANLRNSHEMTPLHAAINRFHKTPSRCAAIVELLMAAGADPLAPCENIEAIEHWSKMASEGAAKQPTNEVDRQAKTEANEAAERAKLLQRSRSARGLIAAQRNNDDLQWLATNAAKYTTPLAMAQTAKLERVVELLTEPRFRRVETRDLAAMIIERAMMHHWLLESFASGHLSKHPMLGKYFELYHHVLHCFNPYSTSVILATLTRPRVLKTKLAVGLPLSIVDVSERQICELVTRQLEVEVQSATGPPPTPRSRYGSQEHIYQKLERMVNDFESKSEMAPLHQLGLCLMRVARASQSHAYDVGPMILASVNARFDEAVEMAICMMIESRAPPQAFVYVAVRDDAQFGPHVCYDSPLQSVRRTVIQELVAVGDIAKLEAVFECAPQSLEHRFLNDRALIKLAVDKRQAISLVWMDFVCERAATQRRRMYEKRDAVGRQPGLADTAALHRERNRTVVVERDAKLCKAPNRENYTMITTEGSPLMHLLVSAARADLLDFVFTIIYAQMALCDAQGKKPLELANLLLLNDKLSARTREDLTKCVALMRGTAHVPTLVLPPSVATNGDAIERHSPKTITSPRRTDGKSPRKKTPRVDEEEKWETIQLVEGEVPEETTTPRRHKHRSQKKK